MGAFAAAGAIVVGTVLSYSAQQQAADAMDAQGKAQQQAANYKAQAMQIQAGQERAASQRQAINQRRTEQLAISRGTALAAASGGGATDPSIITTQGQIVREGELNALTDLYHGEQTGRDLESGADLTRFEGASAASGASARANATRMGSYGSLFSGLGQAGSLYSKYGGGGGGDTSGLIGYGSGSYSSPGMGPSGITWADDLNV